MAIIEGFEDWVVITVAIMWGGLIVVKLVEVHYKKEYDKAPVSCSFCSAPVPYEESEPCSGCGKVMHDKCVQNKKHTCDEPEEDSSYLTVTTTEDSYDFYPEEIGNLKQAKEKILNAINAGEPTIDIGEETFNVKNIVKVKIEEE